MVANQRRGSMRFTVVLARMRGFRVPDDRFVTSRSDWLNGNASVCAHDSGRGRSGATRRLQHHVQVTSRGL
jgi:hypothetical protein